MRRKGRSLEKAVRYGMRLSGAILSLLLLGKGMGTIRMEFWNTFLGKQGARQTIFFKYVEYQYPIHGTVRNSLMTRKAGLLAWIRNQNPVIRYLSQEKTAGRKCLWMKIRLIVIIWNGQVFYEEHEYLLWYGDEERAAAGRRSDGNRRIRIL